MFKTIVSKIFFIITILSLSLISFNKLETFAAPPVVDSISPNSYYTTGGKWMTITGNGFTFYDAGVLDMSSYFFGLNKGANESVNSIIVQPDGKILVAGFFSYYNNEIRQYIARLNPDGRLDTDFESFAGTNAPIAEMALQPDGKILIAGQFDKYVNGIDEVTRNKIARLNPDGTLDTDFDPAGSISASDFSYSEINSIALQEDGKILIAGWFDSYNGEPVNNIARLNSDGTLDDSFDVGLEVNYSINSVIIDSNNKILVGGYFTEYGGLSRNNIARLNSDGTLDDSFDVGSGFTHNFLPNITSLTLQEDGKILAGGYFREYRGFSRNNIARLNSDGTLDDSFDVGSGTDGVIYAITVDSENKILLSGFFNLYNDEAIKGIARLNTNGSLDESFNPGTGTDTNTIYSIALQEDGKILIGGWFNFYNGENVSNIARLGSQVNNIQSVSIGGNECNELELFVTSDTELACTIPPGTLGVKDVMVTNLDGESGILQNSFTYKEGPLTEGKVIFSEINWAGSSVSSEDEWIELYNTEDIDVDIFNWTIEGSTDDSTGTGNINLDYCLPDFIIPAKGYLLISKYSKHSPNTLLNKNFDCLDSTFSFDDSGENLILRDANGNEVDSFIIP